MANRTIKGFRWHHSLVGSGRPGLEWIKVASGYSSAIYEGGIITQVDLRTGNFGSRRTSGVDISLRGSIDALGGTVVVGAVYIGINMFSDLLYRLADPRSK